jgi:hypothetical protein
MSSDTTAFLAGCAIAGVAAVLMLRGGIVTGEPRVVQPLQLPNSPPAAMPTPAPSELMSTSSYPQGAERSWQLQRQLEQQEVVTQELKALLDRQQIKTEDLKEKFEEQQDETEEVIAELRDQVRDQQRIIESMTLQQQTATTADQIRVMDQLRAVEQPPEISPNNQPIRLQTTVLWIAGGALLLVVLGGGAVLLIVVVMLMLSTQKRQPKTTNIIHPMAQPYIFPEQALLPPAPRTKRTRQIEYVDD